MRKFDVRTDQIIKTIGKVASAAVGAGLIVFLTAETPNASVAEGTGAQIQRLAKSDRLPIATRGTACSKRGWPHYEQGCLFDQRGKAGDVHTVRVVELERRDLPSDAPVIKILALR